MVVLKANSYLNGTSNIMSDGSTPLIEGDYIMYYDNDRITKNIMIQTKKG